MQNQIQSDLLKWYVKNQGRATACMKTLTLQKIYKNTAWQITLNFITLMGLGLHLEAAVIPGTSLTPTVWWDANAANNILGTSTYSTNPAVIQLTDQSGNGNNAVVSAPAQPPVLITNAVNGLSTLSFLNTNVLISPTGATLGNSSHSIFVVSSYVLGTG